jgi:hypothetical protein
VAEELVARFVPQRIVDAAEVVQIDEESGNQPLIAAGLLQRVGETLLV